MMKTFIKSVVIILLFGITWQVFPQQMLYKSRQNTDQIFYDGNTVRDFLKQRVDFDTL